MLIASGSFRNEKVLHWSAFRRDTRSVNFLGLLIGIVLFFCFLPVLPFVSYQSPLHVTHPFTLVWSNQQRKLAMAIFLCVPPQSLNQSDFTAFNHHSSESRKSQKSFTRHIASYLAEKAREGSIDWRQLLLLVGLEFAH